MFEYQWSVNPSVIRYDKFVDANLRASKSFDKPINSVELISDFGSS
jgi:hypothetical protein